ncbi:MAG: sigma-70 family RNA polymerase sigma factor [Planctomycetes bacterium]|nr:sigma-70 family RNA polymerase sigma factor [Planctomycetota bacterium]
MDPTATPRDIEELLAQSVWVRRLARRLVVDPQLGEDVAQQSLLAALEQRPLVRNLQAWLTRLVRNTAWQMNRAEKSRRRHERESGALEHARPPEDLVAEAELHRRIVGAVIALEEPYRRTVLERYFRGRTAEEIARREGVPAGTVRSRLKRALDLLRARFEPEQRTERGAWLALLLPVAPVEPAVACAATTLTVGGLVMSVKGIVLAVAAIAAATGAFFWATGGDESPRSSAGGESVVAVTNGGAEEPEAAVPAPVVEAGPGEAAQDPEAGMRREVVPRSGTVVAGHVVDKATGAPVSRFRISASRRVDGTEGKGSQWDVVRRETIESADGAFQIPLDEIGHYRLWVATRRHRATTLDDLEIVGPEGVTDLLVELDPGLSVSGRVLDDRTNRPVPGAVVGSAGYSKLERLALGDPEGCLHAVTGEDGTFTLSGLEAKSQKIAAVHDDYAEGWQQILPGEEVFLEIRLKRGAAIFGTVFDDSGQPKEGVWITLCGDELPLQRPLVSGKDGAYRTPPVRPGIVELHAEGAAGFSAEWQATEIADEDMQVDFGTRSDYVSWRGTFYGYDGEPQAHGFLLVVFKPTDYTGHRDLISHNRDAQCDDQGRFEFPKLPTGQYLVFPSLADGSLARDHPTLHFDQPGLVELDIRLDVATIGEGLGAIRGVVIDGATNAPVALGGYGFVMASTRTPVYKSYTVDLDQQGGFHLRNLPPGDYLVQANVSGRASASQHVLVGKGETIDDVRIVLPPSGTLRLRLTGFLEIDPREFSVVVAAEGGGRGRSIEKQMPENGAWEVTWPLAEGDWTATVSFAGLGQAVRSFPIHPGRVTEVRIEREGLTPFAGAVTVEGSLRSADGTALANTRLSFWAEDVPGVEGGSRSKSANTDQDGLFSACGFGPGLWRVHVALGNGDTCMFPGFVIPPQPVSPHSLHLVLPAGSVRGILVNRLTGQPLAGEGPTWCAHVIDRDANRGVAQTSARTGGRLEVPGIPAGNLVLSVTAHGFAAYTSEVFRHSGLGDVDLGRILLDPCGVLDFTVVDDSGQPVTGFHVFLDGEPLSGRWVEQVGDNLYRCSALPAGTMTFEVRAEGYRTASKTMTLQAGEPAAARFVLERRGP